MLITNYQNDPEIATITFREINDNIKIIKTTRIKFEGGPISNFCLINTPQITKTHIISATQ